MAFGLVMQILVFKVQAEEGNKTPLLGKWFSCTSPWMQLICQGSFLAGIPWPSSQTCVLLFLSRCGTLSCSLISWRGSILALPKAAMSKGTQNMKASDWEHESPWQPSQPALVLCKLALGGGTLPIWSSIRPLAHHLLQILQEPVAKPMQLF